jgi:hypothetical protein
VLKYSFTRVLLCLTVGNYAQRRHDLPPVSEPESLLVRGYCCATLRKRVTPEYLQYIADIYTNAVIDGQNPVQTIMGTERVKHRTASEYATKARKQGLLPETDPGIVTINRPTAKKGKK